IREHSGGKGHWGGGNGGTRRIRFLQAMTASILANNRHIPPFGMAGGSPGQTGRNWVERADGTRQTLGRSEEHTSELQSLMRISYAVFCLKKKTIKTQQP